MAITKEVNIVVKESGLDEVNKKVNKLENSVESLEDQQRSLSKSLGDSSQSVLDNGGAMGLLNDATGGLAMTVKDAVEASWLFTKSQKAAAIQQSIATTIVGTSTGAMKAFRIAVASTGIGLLVIGLGLLIANFDKVKKSVLAFIPGLAIVGDIFSSLVQTVTDFVGATSDASRELDRLGSQADKTLAKNKFALEAYGDTYDDYTKRKIEANSKYAQHVKDINEDETLSEKQKLERLKILRATANREILKAEDDRNADLAKKRKEEQDKIDEKNKEAANKAKEARKKAADEKAAEEKRIADEKAAADLESAKEALAIVDELKKNAESPTQKEQREFEEKKDILEANNLSVEELTRQHLIKIAEIEDEERQKKIDSDKEAKEKKLEEEKKFNDNLLQAEESLKNAKLDAANFTTNLITQLAGKNKAVAIAMLAVEKGLAIAQIVSGAGKAIANASANLAATPAVIGVVPNPMYAVQAAATAKGIAATKISAATSIASILAQSITSAKGLSSGGDVGSGSGSGVSAPQAPSFNLVQGTGRNQIAEGLSKQAPVKAFVVARDMSTGQEMDRNIIKSASL